MLNETAVQGSDVTDAAALSRPTVKQGSVNAAKDISDNIINSDTFRSRGASLPLSSSYLNVFRIFTFKD